MHMPATAQGSNLALRYHALQRGRSTAYLTASQASDLNSAQSRPTAFMQHNSSNRGVHLASPPIHELTVLRHHGQPAERLPTGAAPWRVACPSVALNATPAKYALVLTGLIGGPHASQAKPADTAL